jgi:hypothetical protein
MSTQQKYDLARWFATVLAVGSAGLAVAAKTPALGLSDVALGWISVAQAVIAAALALSPRVQGDGHDRPA